jgi:hypothetical protein
LKVIFVLSIEVAIFIANFYYCFAPIPIYVKQIHLSFVLAVAAQLPAQSQPYMHLPDSSVIWQSETLLDHYLYIITSSLF